MNEIHKLGALGTGELNKYTELAIEYATLYGGNFLLAILTLIIGLWIIGSTGARRTRRFTGDIG